MKVFNKIGTMWSKMRPSQHAYAILWMVTGACLVALIVVLVALRSASQEKKPGHWEYSIDYKAYTEATSPNKPSKPDDFFAVGVTLKNGEAVTPDHPATSNLDAIKMIENAPNIYQIADSDNQKIYSWPKDGWKAKPSDSALNAENAIAAVSAVFAIVLTAAVFATVISEWLIRRDSRNVAAKTVKKVGGKND